jgi:uncharacterized protein (TIGR02145 family)
LRMTVAWLKDQPAVADAYSLDDNYITIILKSGLKTEFCADETDDAGNSLFRGGAGAAADGIDQAPEPILTDFGKHPTPLANHEISNKKVLLFAADTKSLPAVGPQLAKTVNKLSNAGLGLDVTVLRDAQCNYGVVEHFGDYGLVIMDTHGTKDAFLVGDTLDLTGIATEEEIKKKVSDQIGADGVDKLLTGKLKLQARIKANFKKAQWYKSVIPSGTRSLYFSSQYVELLPKMPNTIIFGNMCNGGFIASTFQVPSFTDTSDDGQVHISEAFTKTVNHPIGAAFINLGLISYYAYTRDIPAGTSRVVHDDFAAEMEDSLVSRLTRTDSTRIAHLKPDNVSEYHDQPLVVQNNRKIDLVLRHFGKDDYSYVKCGEPIIDERDGQKYETVCIGDQKWMAQNLNYDAPGSVTYNGDESNAPIYGRLYNYNKLAGICPKGWHVPSSDDFDILSGYLGDSSGGSMKAISSLWTSSNVGATNKSGFSALPGGFVSDVSDPAGYSINIGYSADFATTTLEGSIWQTYGILADSYTLDVFERHLIDAVSCRCIKDN